MARQFFTGVQITAGDENTLFLDTGTTGQQTAIFYKVNGSHKFEQRVGSDYEIYSYAASEWSLHLDGSTGRLGLGTTNPGARLDVEGGALGSTSGNSVTAAIIRAGRQNLVFKDTRTANDTDWRNATFKIIAQIDSTNHQSIDFVNDNNYAEHIDIRTGNQVFHSRFTANGRLGIGLNNPSVPLHVSGTQIRLDGGAGGFYKYNSSGGFRAAWYDDGTDTKIFADGDGSNPVVTFSSGNSQFAGIVSVPTAKTFRLYNAAGTGWGEIGLEETENKIQFNRGIKPSGNVQSDQTLGTSTKRWHTLYTGAGNFTDNVTMTKSSGNNQLYINSSGGGAPVIYMEDPNKKWGQFVSNGHMYIKDETANVIPVKIQAGGTRTIFAADTIVNSYSGTAGVEVYKNAGDSVLMIHQDDGNHESKLHFRTGGNDTQIIVPASTNALQIDTETTSDAFVLGLDGALRIGPGTTGSPYDSTTFLHVKGTTRSIVQQSSTADAYYMFGDAAANNVAWIGYNHSSNNLNLQSASTITLYKPTDIVGNLSVNGNIILTGSSNEIIKSNGSVRINIDSDNNQTDRVFIVSNHSNNELFRVDESGHTLAQGVVKTDGYFQVNSSATLLRKYVSSWGSGVQSHDILYNGWTANTGDYTYLKAAGNSTGSHGIIMAADLGTYLGTTDLETGGITDSATAPLNNTWAYFRNATAYIKGDTTFGGDVTVSGDLNITGDINSTSVTNLDVDDKTITVAKGAADSAAADGAGIVVDGASASILYDHTGTQWEINKPLEVKVGSSAITLTEYSNGAAIWLDGSNGDFTGGDYWGIHAYGTTDLAFGYAGATKMTLKSSGNLGIGEASPDELLHLKTTEATIKFESTHGRHSFINQGGGNFHIKAVHSSGVGINYGDTTNPGLLKLYNNTTAKITLDASTGQITSGRLLATAPGTGIHQLVNASTNSTVLQLITTGDSPDLALNFQSDHIYQTGSALHIQNDSQPLYLRGSQTTVGTTSAQSGYELTVSNGPGSSIYTAGKITLANNKAVEWGGGSIRAENNTLKLVATTLIDLQDDTQIQGDLDVTRSSTGQILSRVWNQNTGGNGTSVLRIANSGNQANGARLEFSDSSYYNATVSVDRTNGMRFMVNNNSSSMSDLLNYPALTLATNRAATFSSSVTANSFIKSGGTSSQYLMADGSVSTGGTGVTGTGTNNRLAIWNGTTAIDSDADFYVTDNTLHTTNLQITSDSGFYRETINSNTGGESWNANNGWHRIIEISGGSGRGKCHFLIQTGGGSGTPCRVEAIVNTAWSNANSTLTILHNSYPNFITDIRVVRNSTSGKSFVDIKGGGEDYVTVTILPDGSTSAAIVNFTNVNTLPSGDSKQIEKTITNMIMSLAAGTGSNTSGWTPFQVKYDGSIFTEKVEVNGGQIITPSGVNLALNPNTGVVSVGGVVQASGTGNNTFAGNVKLADDKELIFGAAPDYKIYHNSTTNVNHVSSLLDRQLSLNANQILLTNQANNSTYLHLTSSSATFANKISSPHTKYCNTSISNSYVRVYYAAANTSQLSTAVRLTGTSHGNSHVANFTADILVNHYQDVVIQSSSGGYTQVTLKVSSNNNGDYTLFVKSASSNAATYYFKIEALSDNVDLTTLPSSTSSSNTEHEHTTVFGTNKTGEGGNIQHKVTGSLRVDDGNNYVEISEGSNSIGQIELHDSTSVFLQGWGSDFRVAVNGAYDNVAMKITNSKNTTLYGTLDVSGTGTSSIGGDLKMLSGTGGTTAKVIFQTTDNNDTSKFIRTNAYWNEYGAHRNEGHKFIDSNSNVLLQLNGDNSGTGNGALSVTTAGNLHTHNVFIPSNKSVQLADRHAKVSFQLPYFTNATSNLAVDLILGNDYINGVLDLKLTSGYSHQNAVGELHLKWIVGFNPNGSIWYTPHLVKSHVTSQQASQIYVDPPAWDSTNSRYFIRIYHKVNSGNVWEGTLENLSQNRATTLVSNFSVGSLLTSTSTTNTHPRGLYISDSSGDALLTLQSKTGGDPTIVMNSEAANRSGLIKYQDNGTNIGRIEYVHNGDKLQLQAGSATGYALQLENTKGIFSGNVGFAGTDPSYHIDINRATNDGWLARFKNTGTTPYGIHVDTSNSASTSYTFAAYTANANDFYIRNDGKVGVGAPSPTHTIHVKNNADDVRGIMIEQAVTNSYAELAIKSDLREFRLGTGGDGTNNTRAENKFYIYDATTGGAAGHRFEIDSAGDVKILNGALRISGDDANYVRLYESGAGDFTIDSAGDITLDAAGNDIRFFKNGVEYGKFKSDSSDFAIYSSVQDKDMIFRGNDGGTTIDALILDMSNGGSATFRDDVDINSGVLNLTKQNGSPTVNMLYDGTNPTASTLLHYFNFKVDYDGTHQDWGGIEHRTTGSSSVRTQLNFNVKSASGNVQNALTLEGQASAVPNATFAGDVQAQGLYVGSSNTSFDFYNNGTTYLNGTTTIDAACTINGQLTLNPDADSQLILGNGGTNASVVFAGTGDDLYLGGNNTSAVRLFSGGAAEFYGAVYVPEYIYHSGDTDTYIRFTTDLITFRADANDLLQVGRFGGASNNGTGTNVGRQAYADNFVAKNLGGANLIRKGTDVAVSGVREEVTGPDGGRKVQAHASTGNGNSGHCYNWYTSENVRIDPEKDYEFSVWIKSTGDDHVYLGWHEYASNGNRITGNPYFHTGKIKTYANSNNSSTVASPNVNGWVLLKYQLKSHRTSSGQADTSGTDRYATHGNPKQHSGATGVMHSDAYMIHLRLGSCYGSVNGSKTYFYNPKITEAQNDDIKHFLRAGQVDCMQTVAVQSGQRVKFDGISGHTFIQEEGDNNLKFYVGNTERLNLTSDMAAFVGYADIPEIRMNQYLKHNGDLNTNINFESSQITIATSGGSHIQINNDENIYFRTNGTNRFKMDTTGTFIATNDIIAFGSVSDKSYKENIKPITGALELVDKLKGVTFDWKEDTDTNKMVGIKEDIGFIAQDVQEVLPTLVRENDNGKLSIRDKGIVPVLVEAIKELKQEIEQLKKQINNG